MQKVDFQLFLTDNLYSTEKVLQIFESFQTIAELVLLFLTSVESIELYRRRHGQVSVLHYMWHHQIYSCVCSYTVFLTLCRAYE